MGLFSKKPNLLPSMEQNTNKKRESQPKKKLSATAKKRLWITLVNTIVIFALYYILIALIHSVFWIKVLMAAYVLIPAVLLIIYFVYNQGFVYKGVTPEMLPDTLSIEQKNAVLARAEARRQSSLWLLTFLIPFLVTLICEACILFIWEPYLKNLFGQLLFRFTFCLGTYSV